jgi:hypothetical protein
MQKYVCQTSGSEAALKSSPSRMLGTLHQRTSPAANKTAHYKGAETEIIKLHEQRKTHPPYLVICSFTFQGVDS